MTEVAVGLIKCSEGYIFHRRPEDHKLHGGMLGLLGGHVEVGENALTTLNRELQEELLDPELVSVGKFLGRFVGINLANERISYRFYMCNSCDSQLTLHGGQGTTETHDIEKVLTIPNKYRIQPATLSAIVKVKELGLI